MKSPATYVLWGAEGCLYVGATEHIGQRLTNHSNQKPWWSEVTSIEVHNYATVEESRRAEADLIAEFRPTYNSIRRHVSAPKWGTESATDALLSVSKAATELRITERAVRHRIKAGKITALKTGPGTAPYVITRTEVERVATTDVRRAS